MKSIKFIFATTLIIIIASYCSDKEVNPTNNYIKQVSQLDGYFSTYMQKYDRLSISAAIVKNQNLVWSKAYGYSIKELNLKASTETVYMTASFSKTFVAVSILQLVEAGKINLDENINTYLDFNVTNPFVPTKPILVRHLMTHTSGIVDNHYGELLQTQLESFYFNESDPTISIADMCKSFLSPAGQYYSQSTFVKGIPGDQSNYSYSNLATTLLAYIVERVAQKPFETYTKENIFVPLGMKKTSWRISDFSPTEMAYMYKDDGTPWGNYTIALFPAGALRSTVNDMSIYLRTIGAGGIFNNTRILKSASVDLMLKTNYTIPGTDKLKIGLIWGVEGMMGSYSNLFGYIGESEGSETYMWFNPKTKVGAIVMINQDYKIPEDANTLGDVMANMISVGESQ